jgi:multidrug efflux pump subunit AcrB
MREAGWLKFRFFPTADSDYIHAEFEFPGGTPVTTVEAASRQLIESWEKVEADLGADTAGGRLSVASYALVGGTLGLENSDPQHGDHLGDVFIELLPSEDRPHHYETVLQAWRDHTGTIPGAASVKFLGFAGGPPGSTIQIDLIGEDETALVQALEELVAHLHTYAGVKQVNTDYKPGKKELRIRLKPTAETLGVTLAGVGAQIRAGFYGDEVARIQRGADEVKVMVRYTEAERRTLGQLQQMRVRTASGHLVPLAHVADIEFTTGFAKIRREHGKRRFSVSAETDDNTDDEKIMKELQDSFLPGLAQRHGVRTKRGFDSADRMKSISSIKIGAIVAILVIFLIMATIFKSYLQPGIILFTIPLGAAGAIVGHLIYGVPISVMTFFGLVALTGVVVNDAIVLIVAINERLAAGLPLFVAMREAGKRRFRAIVLTSLTTFAGLFPMILEKSFQAQILIPMAITIAFGVATATFGTLLLIPCLLGVLNDLRCFFYLVRHGALPPTRETVEPSCNIGSL